MKPNWAVAALTLAGALLRLPTLGSQSLWLDETLTGRLARGDLASLFDRLAIEEANPPLYYLAMWGWTRVAGFGDVALRLPSALCGIALIPVGYLLGSALGSRRAGVVLAALLAANPLLVYYSQEARGYAAVALLVALGLLFFQRALQERPGRPLLWWAVCAVLALGVHWFAALPVLAEAVVLAWRRRRAALPALAAVTAAAAALAPLALEQRSRGVSANVTDGVSLAERVKGVPTSWLVGERGSAVANLEWGLAAIAAAALALLALKLAGAERRRAATVAAVGGAGLLALLAAAVLGADYVNNRNTIPLLVPLLAALAVALSVRAAGNVGPGLAVGLCAGMAIAAITAQADEGHERHDWRGVERSLGAAPAGGRAVILAPRFNDTPLRWYRDTLVPAPPEGLRVRTIDVVLTDVEQDPPPKGSLSTPPAPGFVQAGFRFRQRMFVARYVAREPSSVRPADVDRWARAQLDPARGAGGAATLDDR